MFVVVALPLYLLGMGLYRWGYSLTAKEITHSLNNRTSYFMGTLENEIKRIKKVHQECLHDEDIYYYVNASSIMTTYEQVKSLLRIEKRLNVLYDSSNYIEDVTLWMPRQPYTISVDRGVDKAASGWQELISSQKYDSESGLIYYQNNLYICSAYPIGYEFSGIEPLYILAIKLSSDKIAEEMLGFNLYDNSGTLLENPDTGFSLLVGEDIDIATGSALKSAQAESKDTKSVDLKQGTSAEKYMVVSVPSVYLNMELYSYVAEKGLYGDLSGYRIMFVVFTMLSGILVSAYFWFSNRLINRPIKKLVHAFTELEQGNLDMRIEHLANDEFSYLYETFNQMAESLDNMLQINYRQQVLTKEANLRQLQAQINPHFLHNSFFILYRMAKDEDYQNITEFLTYLSDYYRYITRNAKPQVMLSDEDGHARRYVQIQLIRFKKHISARFEPLPGEISGLQVPRLILQPLLENAFNHGFKDTVSGGMLKIWYETKGDTLEIHVSDNGTGLDGQELKTIRENLEAPVSDYKETTGVINIHQRIQTVFGKNYGISINSEKGQGTDVVLRIPLDGRQEKLD